jgi:hypothetical protein
VENWVLFFIWGGWDFLKGGWDFLKGGWDFLKGGWERKERSPFLTGRARTSGHTRLGRHSFRRPYAISFLCGIILEWAGVQYASGRQAGVVVSLTVARVKCVSEVDSDGKTPPYTPYAIFVKRNLEEYTYIIIILYYIYINP